MDDESRIALAGDDEYVAGTDFESQLRKGF